MKLIVLGETTEKKGAELERLCRRLFISLGYRNLVLNAVGAGGNEYDVTGEKSIVTENGSEIVVPLFAECKAYNKPCDINHWEKFLGKYHIKYVKNRNVEGYFVALSDVNGNVWGAAEDFLSSNNKIHLIAKDNLINFLQEEFHLSDSNHIRHLSNLYTNRAVDTIDIIIFDNSVYWLVRYNSTDFSLFSSADKPLSATDFASIKQMFPRKDFYKFIDIVEEKEKQDRILLIKGFILSCALTNTGDSQDKMHELIVRNNFDFNLSDVFSLITETDFVTNQFPFHIDVISSKIEFFRYLNSLCVLSTIFTSQKYQELIDEDFLDEILTIQGNLKLSLQQRRNALYILKLSPNAIYKVIYPDNFLINSSRNSNLFQAKFHEKIQQQCVSKFFELLLEGLKANYEMQPFWDIWYKLGVTKLSFIQGLSINQNTTSEIKVDLSPIIHLAPVSNLPSNPVIPIVMFEETEDNHIANTKDSPV